MSGIHVKFLHMSELLHFYFYDCAEKLLCYLYSQCVLFLSDRRISFFKITVLQINILVEGHSVLEFFRSVILMFPFPFPRFKTAMNLFCDLCNTQMYILQNTIVKI
jgi:hypothetical protein